MQLWKKKKNSIGVWDERTLHYPTMTDGESTPASFFQVLFQAKIFLAVTILSAKVQI